MIFATAVAVVITLLFFTTVRLSPVGIDSAFLDKAPHKQRVLTVDTLVYVNVAPVALVQPAVAEEHAQPDFQAPSPVAVQLWFFNRPPPVSL